MMFKCEICGREFEKMLTLANHIAQGHKIKKEEYYLKYINPEKGKCAECGKETKYINLRFGYHKHCSVKCSVNSEEVRNKSKESCIKKYGCEYSFQSREVQNKRKETCMKNFGCEHPNQSEEIKNKRKETCMKNFGCEYPMQNIDIAKTNGSKRKLNFKRVQKKYPNLIKCEELISGPNGEVLGHCKNSSCKNSKEGGGYFELTIQQIYNRNLGVNSIKDGDYLYCCDECKKECPLFHRTANALNNILNAGPEVKYTNYEYTTFKNEVFKRQLKENKDHSFNYCEKCHSTENLIIHHIQPQKLEPGYALDPPNGIVLCQKCHFEIGHEKGSECSTGSLANKICK